MKVIIAVVFMFFVRQELQAQTAGMTIIINNVKAGRGNLVINLFNSEESWFKKEFLKKTIKADQSSMTVSLDVPDGVYGVAIYQDLDSDGKLKYGMFKIPKEPVAFGNNFKPTFSAPTFRVCAVTVNGNTTITLKLY